MFSSIVGCGVLRELNCANNACTGCLFQMSSLRIEGEERAAPYWLPVPGLAVQNHARKVRKISATQIDARYESLQTRLATYLCPPVRQNGHRSQRPPPKVVSVALPVSYD